VRQRLFVLFDEGGQSIIGRIIEVGLVIAIVVSTVSFIMESMPDFRLRPPACHAAPERTVANCEPVPDPAFADIEAVCIAIFTVDYVMRISMHHSMPSEVPSRLQRTLNYAKLPLNVIDLLAIMPFYLTLAVGDGVGPLRVLRLARILRLFKAAKHHPGIMMLAEVMIMSGQPLLILVFFNVIITVLFGALIYFAEGMEFSVAPEFTVGSAGSPPDHPMGVYVRPDASLMAIEVSPFRSIPYAVWWVLTTMTTVGYGDMSPTSPIGKLIGIACFYVGVIFLALPISVLGTNFEIVYNRLTAEKLAKEARKPQRRRKSKSKPTPKRGRPSIKIGKTPWIPRTRSLRMRIFLLLEDPGASRLGKYISIFIIMVIVVSTASFIMETMPSFRYISDRCTVGELTVEDCEPKPDPFFYQLEVVCIIIFTIDYIIRMASVGAAQPEECGIPPPTIPEEDQTDEEVEPKPYTPAKITFLYATQVLNMIDCIAIVPFYVEIAGGGGGGASVLRVLRLVRVFRVLRMPKMRACAEMFINVVADALPALALLFFITALMSVLFASLIVFAEGSHYSVDHFRDDFPDGLYIRPTKTGHDIEPSPFRSILYAFWWFFTTATTVGYGDDFPTTTAGRCVGVATFYTGIVLIALPITIVVGCFNKHYPDWVKEFGSKPKVLSLPDNPPTPAYNPHGDDIHDSPVTPIGGPDTLEVAENSPVADRGGLHGQQHGGCQVYDFDDIDTSMYSPDGKLLAARGSPASNESGAESIDGGPAKLRVAGDMSISTACPGSIEEQEG
jgi:hypothetical protein